jgi:hypothetical protein
MALRRHWFWETPFQKLRSLNLLQNIQNLPATSFGAEIGFNDFTDYNTAVLVNGIAPAPYNLPSELSVSGLGNFWGTGCGVDLSASTVKNSDGTLNSFVTDSHPSTYRSPEYHEHFCPAGVRHRRGWISKW